MPIGHWRLAAISAGIWIALALAGTTSQWRLWELKGFDLLSAIGAEGLGPIVPPITIVAIDEASFAELRQQWPWPRGMHGDLVEQLARAGAAVIAFDVVFAEASDERQDAYFADAIKQAGNVVLASDIATQETEQFAQIIRVDPHHLFKKAGALSGVAAVDLDRDLVLRALPRSEDAFWRQVLRRHPAAAVRAIADHPVGDHAFIRYVGPDHSFPYVSYYQALDPDQFLPPGSLEGRIVLVGRDVKTSPDGAAGKADMFATPLSLLTGRLTPGVEIHANALATMLTGSAIRELPRGAAPIVLAIVIAVAAWGMRRWRPVRSAALGLALTFGIVALGWGLFERAALWMPMLASAVAVALTYVSQGGAAFLREQERRRQIKAAFSHYVSPDVVNDLIAHPEKLVLGGERRELTLLFTDLAGFTSLSEGLAPEAVAKLMNQHLTEMTRIVLSHGGTVDKFIGDAVMAFWNAPSEDPDHVKHACEAALAMQAAMKVMRAESAARGLPPLHMRIGLHSGTAVVGNMGSEDRFDYTAIGDNVNLAARLEGVNKLYGTEILTSDAIAAALAGRLPVRAVDRVRVKGRALPVGIYTLVAEEGVQALNDAAIAAYRAQEWDRSTALWQELMAIKPEDSIARVYLARIPGLRATPPPDPWDGSVPLEKM